MPDYTILYIIISALLAYIVFLLFYLTQKNTDSVQAQPISIQQSVNTLSNLDRFNDPFSPPLRNDYFSHFPGFGGYRGYGFGRSLDIRGSIPIQISVPTQGYPMEYTQIGILTKDEDDKHPLILPLMGRMTSSSRNKFQYYTISNTGSNNTKLPIKRKGRTCTSEIGCDELYSGDEVFVEGYKTKFTATVYETNTFQYGY